MIYRDTGYLKLSFYAEMWTVLIFFEWGNNNSSKITRWVGEKKENPYWMLKKYFFDKKVQNDRTFLSILSYVESLTQSIIYPVFSMYSIIDFFTMYPNYSKGSFST